MSPSAAASLVLLALGAATLLPQTAVAQESTSAHRHAIGGKLGTTGFAAEYSYSWAELPMYGLRANLSFGSYEDERTKYNVLYKGTVEFNSLMVLFDAHPYRNGFRASAGLMFNDNSFRARGQPVAATVNINGNAYPATEVINPRGEVTFSLLSPYFGIGWGAPTTRSGVFWSFDLGVAYMRGKVRVGADCGPGLSAADCARLQRDLQIEQAEFQNDLRDYRLYPVLTFGAGYRF